jgi:uncharacterized membrane protein YvbJ
MANYKKDRESTYVSKARLDHQETKMMRSNTEIEQFKKENKNKTTYNYFDNIEIQKVSLRERFSFSKRSWIVFSGLIMLLILFILNYFYLI